MTAQLLYVIDRLLSLMRYTAKLNPHPNHRKRVQLGFQLL
ncbi:hypothetical protein IAD21_04436 [Abditibacteriota bacterium]|nr:hypothetical protein IAD21_04436 [Abditibacteriota bacterium]